VGIDGEGEGDIDALPFELGCLLHPDVEVLAPVAGRGVDEARSILIGDVTASEQWDIKTVSQFAKRVGADEPGKIVGRYVVQSFVVVLVEAGGFEDIGGTLIGKDQRLPALEPVVGGRAYDLIEPIGDLRRVADRAVARDGPWRRRPNGNARSG